MARYDGRVPCTEIPERAPFSNPACHPPVWGALLEFALRFRQGSWLDQQALSFIAVSAPAEAHHHGVPWAFRLGSTREQRIPGGQIFKIVETRTSQARRARIFHDEKSTAAAAPVTRPRIMQRFDHYQLGRAARPLYQVLLLVLGKVARNPMRAIQLFDCRVSTLAEAQRSPRRRLRDIVGLTWDQSLRCGPRPKQLHGLGNARQIVCTAPSRWSNCPCCQRLTAPGSSHPIPTSTSIGLTYFRAASATSAALITRSLSFLRLCGCMMSSLVLSAHCCDRGKSQQDKPRYNKMGDRPQLNGPTRSKISPPDGPCVRSHPLPKSHKPAKRPITQRPGFGGCGHATVCHIIA